MSYSAGKTLFRQTIGGVNAWVLFDAFVRLVRIRFNAFNYALTFNLKYSFNALLIDREHLGFKMNGQ